MCRGKGCGRMRTNSQKIDIGANNNLEGNRETGTKIKSSSERFWFKYAFCFEVLSGGLHHKRIPRRGMKNNEKKKKIWRNRQTEQDKWTWWGENYKSWVALVEKSCFSLYHTQVFMKVVLSFAVLTRQLKKSWRSSEGHRFQTHDLPSPLLTHPPLASKRNTCWCMHTVRTVLPGLDLAPRSWSVCFKIKLIPLGAPNFNQPRLEMTGIMASSSPAPAHALPLVFF